MNKLITILNNLGFNLKLNLKLFSTVHDDRAIPFYATKDSAGMDVTANIVEPIILKPLQRVLVPTGLFMQIPRGYEIQVRPRSGLAIKSGITVLNTPGTVDADYRNEIGVILINLSNADFTINPKDRIAQLVLNKIERVNWKFVPTHDDLSKTKRGLGGFGSTGK